MSYPPFCVCLCVGAWEAVAEAACDVWVVGCVDEGFVVEAAPGTEDRFAESEGGWRVN